MPTLRSKKENAKEASHLLKWMRGGGKKSDTMKEPEVKELKKPNSKVEEGNEDEDSEVSDESEEGEQEWKPKRKEVTKVKKAAKSKGQKAVTPENKKVNKRNQEKVAEDNEDEDSEVSDEGEGGEQEWVTKVKKAAKLKGQKVAKLESKEVNKQNQEEVSKQNKEVNKQNQEEVEEDDNILDQEDEEAQQAEDAKHDFNEYERQRQENILKNKLLLQQLQLDSIALGSKPKSKPKPAHKPAPRKKKESSTSTTEHVPRRQSNRIARLPVDSGNAKRKYEEESAALEQAEREKRRRVEGDIKFDVGGIDFSVKGARYERTFTDEDVKNTENTGVKKLREKMMGLKLYERWAPNSIKITPERTYYLGFHPTADKQLIFAGDKLGTLGVWDASSSKPNPDAEEDDNKEHPAISQFKIHPRTISSFTFSPFSMNTILTASYDSSIRSFDLAKGLSTEVYFGEDEEGISGVEIHDDNPYLVYFSTLEGRVGRKDTRYNGKADVWRLSDKKIGGFSMHPKQTHLCVTASLDRTIKIWDLRKIISGHKSDEDYNGPMPAMIGEHTSRLSVSSAYWNRKGSIATTSYDDTVKIYRFPNAGLWVPGAKIPAADCGGEVDGEVEPSTVIKHNNQTGRWVTILRAQWQQNPRDGADKFVIGNMNRFFDIYSEDGAQLAQLGDDSLTAVPAAAQFHPTENWVAGATASGKVALFL